uniref:(northern house mosquito) hypothetical protein n=1 Tax=Culex pipiens TaxID=7175 RepID=A0A8D8KGH5_CULPI
MISRQLWSCTTGICPKGCRKWEVGPTGKSSDNSASTPSLRLKRSAIVSSGGPRSTNRCRPAGSRTNGTPWLREPIFRESQAICVPTTFCYRTLKLSRCTVNSFKPFNRARSE